MFSVCGIDLGTTKCSVYTIKNGDIWNPVKIKDKQGNAMIPSTIYAKNNEFRFGLQAEEMKLIEPENVYYGIKKFIGRRY